MRTPFQREFLSPVVRDGDVHVVFFVTLACAKREYKLGHIRHGIYTPWRFGMIADQEWLGLRGRYPFLGLGPFQFMPDHFHALISIPLSFAMPHGSSPNTPENHNNGTKTTPRNPLVVCRWVDDAGPDIIPWSVSHRLDYRPPVLSTVIGSYKSLSTLQCLKHHKEVAGTQHYTPLMGRLWARGYYARLLKTPSEVNAVTRYIHNNPKNWKRNL